MTRQLAEEEVQRLLNAAKLILESVQRIAEPHSIRFSFDSVEFNGEDIVTPESNVWLSSSWNC